MTSVVSVACWEIVTESLARKAMSVEMSVNNNNTIQMSKPGVFQENLPMGTPRFTDWCVIK